MNKPKFLTFNDGMVNFHELRTDGAPLKTKLCFEYLTIGVKRNYEAAQADVQIDELIRTPLNRSISTLDVCNIGEKWFRIRQIQHDTESLPPSTKFTLSQLIGEIDYVNLISSDVVRDDIGQIVETDSSQDKVLCMVQSVTRTEWNTSHQNNYQAEWMLDVATADYSGQRIAVFRGTRYMIYRTFCKGERTELYLGLRVGEIS